MSDTPSVDTPPPSTRRVLGRGASVSFVLQTGGVALQYVVNVVFARAMSVAQFGVFTVANNYSRIGGTLGHLGGASSVLRFVPEQTVREDWPRVAGVIRRSRQIAIGVGSAVAVIGTALTLIIANDSNWSAALVIALWSVPVVALIELQQSLIRAYKQIFRAFFPWLVFQPILAVAAAGVVVVLDGRVRAPAAVGITAGSYVAAALLQLWWLHQAQPAVVRQAVPAYEMREWTRVTTPIFLSNVVYIVFSRLDVVMVGLFLGPKDAGIYAIAMRAGNLAQIGQTAMSATVAPRISELYFAEREDELQRLVLTSVRWIFAPTLALVILMAAASGPILGVFGKDFVEGRWVLAIIAVGQLVSVSSGPVGWLMNLTGREKLTAKVFAITAVITLGLYLVLIKPFGIIGAAIANSAGIAIFNIVLTLQARRSLGYDVSIVAALKLERRQRS